MNNHSISQGNPGKLNAIKEVFVLCVAAVIVLVLTACSNDQKSVREYDRKGVAINGVVC